MIDVKFWVLTHARSGSNYLCDLLNSTEQLPWLMERLNPVSGITRKEFLKNPSPVAKVLQSHWDALFPNDDLELIQQVVPGIKFILLTRNDHVSVAVSRYLCEQTGVWHSRRGWDFHPYQDIRVPENRLLLLGAYQRSVDLFHKVRALVRNRDHLDISFQQFVASPLETVNRVFGYLGISEAPKVNFEKLEFDNPMPIHPQSKRLKLLMEQIIRQRRK